MSEPVDSQPKPAAPDGATNKRTIAQVEKWMDMIREMSRDETAATKLPAAHNIPLSVTE
jgi:hypothetical protein